MPTSAAPPLGEFALIARYFTHASGERQGVGDDCALIDAGEQTLAITCDLLAEGIHFFADADPEALGHKALAVNLSDLAAAGARPRCFLLGLALPRASAAWLAAFSHGLMTLAREHRCTLIGGDTTRSAPCPVPGAGGVTISITAIGEVDRTRYCGRAGARPGDDLWVSGSLGEAALAVALRRGQIALPPPWREACLARLDRPQPRVDLGRALAGLATATIDVSDGLCADLGHILERSGVGAQVQWESVPRAAGFAALDVALQHRCVLAGGDDYELLFAAPAARRSDVELLGADGVALARIGTVESEPGLRLRNGGGALIATTLAGYDHFAG